MIWRVTKLPSNQVSRLCIIREYTKGEKYGFANRV